MAASDTRRILQSGNFLGMMNVLMQLRKCCNHPDLFAARAIVSPFDMVDGLRLEVGSVAVDIVRDEEEARRGEDGTTLHHLLYLRHYAVRSRLLASEVELLQTPAALIEDTTNDPHHPQHPSYPTLFGMPADAEHIMQERLREVKEARLQRRYDARLRLSRENARRCRLCATAGPGRQPHSHVSRSSSPSPPSTLLCRLLCRLPRSSTGVVS